LQFFPIIKFEISMSFSAMLIYTGIAAIMVFALHSYGYVKTQNTQKYSRTYLRHRENTNFERIVKYCTTFNTSSFLPINFTNIIVNHGVVLPSVSVPYMPNHMDIITNVVQIQPLPYVGNLHFVQ
jgi:hypothetical protein